MLLSTRIKIALVLWIGAEILAFALLVKLIGVGGAVLAGLATSLFGFWLLKRTGMSALAKLQANLNGPRTAAPGRLADEGLAALGAVALLMPGILSDLVGLGLAVPAARARIGRWLGRGGLTAWRTGARRQRGPSEIDLEPDEWRRGEPQRRPIRRSEV